MSAKMRLYSVGRVSAAVLATVASATVCSAATYTYQTINDPADNSLQTPVFNQLLGINDSNVIVGYYGDGTIVPNNGFVYSHGTFTPANVSGADQTQVVAINNTKTNGSFDTAGFWVNNATGANHGFTKIGGVTTNVDGPSSTFTQTLGLNDHLQAVGFYNAANGITVGYLYDATTKVLSTLPLPAGATSLTATGINNAGTIVGFYTVPGATDPFIYQNGSFTTPTDPNGTNAMFFGINNKNQIVGTDTSAGGFSQGLVYNWNANSWTAINDPNASTTANSFNISGTTLNGINDAGDLVGFYAGPGGNVNGLLVTTAPEPGSLGCVALAFLGFGMLAYRRKARKL